MNALVRRVGWHNWQEGATLIKQTANGWRIRWETGLHVGKVSNLTKRNWQVETISRDVQDVFERRKLVEH